MYCNNLKLEISSEMFNISVCGCKSVKSNRWQITHLTYKETAGENAPYAQTS
jgi:hypothetical protein